MVIEKALYKYTEKNNKMYLKTNNCMSVIKDNSMYLIVPDELYPEYQKIAKEASQYIIKIIPMTIFYIMREYLSMSEEFKANKERWIKQGKVHDGFDLQNFCKKVANEYIGILNYFDKDKMIENDFAWIIRDCTVVFS